MLEVLTNQYNAKLFFNGCTNKNTISYFCKNHIAPKGLNVFGKTNGVASLSLAMVQNIVKVS